MPISSVSVRHQTLFFLSVMGIATLVLVVVTALAYRHFSWQSHELAFQRLAKHEEAGVFETLGQNSFDLATRIQHGRAFREKWQQGNWSALVSVLNDQFNQYYFTTGIIPISKLQLFDLSFNLLAESTGGSGNLTPGISVCSQLIEQADKRKGADRLKSISLLCLMSGQPQFATIAPVGGLRVKGYILVASDPLPVIKRLESELDIPIRLNDADGNQLYFSPPEKYKEQGFYLPVSHEIRTVDGELAYQVAIDVDMTDFNQHTQKVFNTVLIIAVVVILVVVLLAVIVMRRTIVFPLEMLSEHLGKIRNDSSLLEKSITVEGNKEVNSVASAFNLMSGELSLMQKRLTDMAYTDSLTGAANRLKFNHFLDSQITRKRRNDDKGFALLIIDLNKLKAVNDVHGHDVGDELIFAVVQRIKNVVRETDLVARLGGDEFAVILPGMTAEEDILKLARKILDETAQPLNVNNVELIPGLSIGISFFPETTSNLKALLKSADHAMYRAKESGGGFMIAPPCPEDCEDCFEIEKS